MDTKDKTYPLWYMFVIALVMIALACTAWVLINTRTVVDKDLERAISVVHTYESLNTEGASYWGICTDFTNHRGDTIAKVFAGHDDITIGDASLALTSVCVDMMP